MNINISTTNNNQAEIEEAVFAGHMRALAEADAACDKARGQRTRVRKQAKIDGILLYELDEAMKFADMGTEEARRHFQTMKQYMAWLRVPIGTQFDLLAAVEDDPTAEDSGEKSEQRTLDEIAGKGYRAGIMGVSQKPALEAAGLKGNDPMGQEFLKAWTAGQSMTAKEMGKAA